MSKPFSIPLRTRLTSDISVADSGASSTEMSARSAPLSKLVADAMEAVGHDHNRVRDSLQRVSTILAAEGRPRQLDELISRGAGLAPWQSHRLVLHIESRLAGAISIAELSRLVCLSSSHFSRVFKHCFDQSPHRYILRRRVECAMRYMLTTNEPLCQIAVACGFADQAHFSRIFRKVTATTPHRWRRANVPTILL
jgi:transcriptional regulator GlxA family with amidase domain